MHRQSNVLCEPSPVIGRWRNNAAVPIPEINLGNDVVDDWLSETSGATPAPWNDFGTNVLTLTGNGSPLPSAGSHAQGKWLFPALFVAASSQYLSRADEAALRVPATGNLTFAAWFYPEAATVGVILAKNTDAALEYYLAFQGDLVDFQLEADGFRYQVTSQRLAINTWYLVLAWLDRTKGECGLMINNTAPRFSGTPGVATGVVGAGFTIGGRVAAVPRYFQGRIEQVCRWNRLLNPAERAALFTTALVDIGGSFYAASGSLPTNYAPPYIIPATPTDLSVTNLGAPLWFLEWTQNGVNAMGIEIWRSRSGGAFELVYTANAYRESSYTDTPIIGDTDPFTYKIRAVNFAGASDWSNEVVAEYTTGNTLLSEAGDNLQSEDGQDIVVEDAP